MNFRNSRFQLSFGGPVTPMVKIILWINGLVYLSTLLAGDRMAVGGQTYTQLIVTLFGLVPSRVFGDFALWQLVTYMFVHISFLHLLFNMLALWWFGADLEARWGSSMFLRYYFFTGVGAALVSVLLGLPTIGASGGVFGLLLAFGLSFPNRVLYIYFLFPVKAKYCVLLFGGLEAYSLLFSPSGGVNHAAHLSGLVFGLIWFALARHDFELGSWWRSYRRNRMKRRLKVIYPRDEEDTDQRHTLH